MSFLQSQVNLNFFFGSKRKIETITVDCIISEDTTDVLTITKQPVQTGASITDHSYLEPVTLNMQILQQVNNPITQFLGTFSQSGLQQLYEDFLDLQAERTPFTVTTPKRVYEDMLISTIRLHTDKQTENILSLNLSFQQVFFATIGSVNLISPALQKNPKKTQGIKKVGKKSAIAKSVDIVGSIFK